MESTLLRYYGPFLWLKLTKELHDEGNLHIFKSNIRKTDLTSLIEDGCRNSMLCNLILRPYGIKQYCICIKAFRL